jgi:hypothetical protein
MAVMSAKSVSLSHQIPSAVRLAGESSGMGAVPSDISSARRAAVAGPRVKPDGRGRNETRARHGVAPGRRAAAYPACRAGCRSRAPPRRVGPDPAALPRPSRTAPVAGALDGLRSGRSRRRSVLAAQPASAKDNMNSPRRGLRARVKHQPIDGTAAQQFDYRLSKAVHTGKTRPVPGKQTRRRLTACYGSRRSAGRWYGLSYSPPQPVRFLRWRPSLPLFSRVPAPSMVRQNLVLPCYLVQACLKFGRAACT